MANSTTKNAKPLAMRSAGATGPGNLPALRSGHPVLPAEAAEAGAVVVAAEVEANALLCSRNLTRTRTASSTKPSASRHANTSSNSEAATEKHAAVHAAAGPQDQAEIRVADPHDRMATAAADPQGRTGIGAAVLNDRMATAAADLQDLTATGAADLQDPMVTGVDSVLAQIIGATVKSRYVIFQKPSGLLPRTKSRRKKGSTTKEHYARCSS